MRLLEYSNHLNTGQYGIAIVQTCGMLNGDNWSGFCMGVWKPEKIVFSAVKMSGFQMVLAYHVIAPIENQTKSDKKIDIQISGVWYSDSYCILILPSDIARARKGP